MENFAFFVDWRFLLFLVTITGIIINWLANHKIMHNHLAHIDEKQDKILEKIDILDKRLDKQAIKIAVLEEKTK